MKPYIYLLCSQDRQKTLKQIDEFFNKKVAPKELVDEIKVASHHLEQLLLNIEMLYCSRSLLQECMAMDK